MVMIEPQPSTRHAQAVVFSLHRLVAMRAAWLVHQPASPKLGHTMHSLRLRNRSGSYISRGDVLEHQLLQALLTNQTLQLGVGHYHLY